jgi:hypothetical protein
VKAQANQSARCSFDFLGKLLPSQTDRLVTLHQRLAIRMPRRRIQQDLVRGSGGQIELRAAAVALYWAHNGVDSNSMRLRFAMLLLAATDDASNFVCKAP